MQTLDVELCNTPVSDGRCKLSRVIKSPTRNDTKSAARCLLLMSTNCGGVIMVPVSQVITLYIKDSQTARE